MENRPSSPVLFRQGRESPFQNLSSTNPASRLLQGQAMSYSPLRKSPPQGMDKEKTAPPKPSEHDMRTRPVRLQLNGLEPQKRTIRTGYIHGHTSAAEKALPMLYPARQWNTASPTGSPTSQRLSSAYGHHSPTNFDSSPSRGQRRTFNQREVTFKNPYNVAHRNGLDENIVNHASYYEGEFERDKSVPTEFKEGEMEASGGAEAARNGRRDSLEGRLSSYVTGYGFDGRGGFPSRKKFQNMVKSSLKPGPPAPTYSPSSYAVVEGISLPHRLTSTELQRTHHHPLRVSLAFWDNQYNSHNWGERTKREQGFRTSRAEHRATSRLGATARSPSSQSHNNSTQAFDSSSLDAPVAVAQAS